MLRLEHDAKYADVMERALYNCVLAGMELDGTKFFYVNPLEALPGISGKARSHPHTLPVRPKWFTCACCPPNVARLLPSVGEYAWTLEENTVYSNLFIGGKLDLGDKLGGSIIMQSGLPYDGRVRYTFESSLGAMNMRLAVRMPDWSENTVINKNGAPAVYEVSGGYAYIEGPFSDSDAVDVEFDMTVKRVYANVDVSDDSNKVALQRGPLVYCAEGADNDGEVLSLSIASDGAVRVGEYAPDELCGVRKLYAEGFKTVKNNGLYSYIRPKKISCEITLIPYYAWANRGLNQMRVWLPEI